MPKRRQYRRLLFIALLLGLAFAGLGFRLVDLQVWRHDELSARAQQNTQREFLLQPRRGDILDCRGNLLATTTFVKTICADPSLIGDRTAEVAHAIAPFLQVTEAELYHNLLPHIRTNTEGRFITNQFVRLKSRVPVETWQAIQQAMASLPLGVDESTLGRNDQAALRALHRKALFARDEPMRIYPNQNLAAHILGYAQTTERVVDGNDVSDIVGRDGIEWALNSKLSGVRGWRLTETDHRGRELVQLREEDVEPRDGLNAVLTIDTVLQHILETALADAMEKHSPLNVCGIVVRPATGEILAMATLPTFDPNNPGASTAEDRRNRVVTDVIEPGSTFKIVVVSGALDDGIVRLGDVFDCGHGRFAYGGRVLHDHEAYGLLSVKNIITKSSNIGAAKIGLRMGEDQLFQYVTRFGFGERTGLPLPSESRGIVHPVEDWSKVSVAQIPMGQGIAVTRLQMTMAMCAIANHGVLMHPMLIKRLEDQEGHAVATYSPRVVRQVIRDDTSRLMVEALKTVVSADGTAPKAALANYTVAGKTGTAQKAGVGGYIPGKYVTSFIGFFPADKPELCISVVFDEPRDGHYGGAVAGPVFKEIAERAASYLNIRPDIGGPTPPQTVAQAGSQPMTSRTTTLNERFP